jgi:hypothetical protein
MLGAICKRAINENISSVTNVFAVNDSHRCPRTPRMTDLLFVYPKIDTNARVLEKVNDVFIESIFFTSCVYFISLYSFDE